MFGVTGGIVATGVGAVLVVAVSIISFNTIPNVLESSVLNSVMLNNGTEQFERFQVNPFPLNFSVWIFNMTNAAEVLNGAVPRVVELGPYVYKLYASREIESQTADKIAYRRKEFFEFDAEGSFPRTEKDLVTVPNIPYLAVLQIVEQTIDPVLVPAVTASLSDVFGSNNGPVATITVEDLLLKGLKLCENTQILSGIVCSQMRNIARDIRNMEIQSDGSIIFSLLRYKDGVPSILYEVSNGIEDHTKLGHILRYNGLDTLDMWPQHPGGPVATGKGLGPCNMINGTDAMIFHPFISKDESIYAFNADICRSVELKFVEESSVEGIDTLVFATDKTVLDHPEHCFCLNRTAGVTGSDGCLLHGAMELQSCVGGPLVLTLPHFLHADTAYRNNILGLTPSNEKHRIVLEIEPYTGSPVRAAKRAQFNVFMQPSAVAQAATHALRTTLVPIFWAEEAVSLPEEYLDLIKTDLVSNLNLISILVPVLMTVSCVVLVAGSVVLARAVWMRKQENPDAVIVVG